MGKIIAIGGGDCYTSPNSDMIINTKHFTQFVAYTPSSSSSSSSSSGTGSSGGKIRSNIVIGKEPVKEEVVESSVVEPIKETPEVTIEPLAQPTTIQEEQGFLIA